MQKDLHTIVLTGGPCAGKTSILSHLMWELPNHGVQAIAVPEAARMLIASGLIPKQVGWDAFQKELFRVQFAHEDSIGALAARLPHGPVVLLCDRGAMDNRAYMLPAAFDQLLGELRLSVTDVRDKRYDAVIHLLTAADGAEAHYALDAERGESPEEARRLDEATRHAWVGHPHLRVIDNSTDFEGKKQRALAEVLHQLGLPTPLEIERKYVVGRNVFKSLPPHAQKVEIEQYYLASDVGQERVRRRGQGEHGVYYRTLKTRLSAGVNEEREWQISPEEYALERDTRAISRVRKDRWCFLYEHQYFELDDFSPMEHDLCLLEVELTDLQQTPKLPSWLGAAKDVTDDPRYGNDRLAFRL